MTWSECGVSHQYSTGDIPVDAVEMISDDKCLETSPVTQTSKAIVDVRDKAVASSATHAL